MRIVYFYDFKNDSPEADIFEKKVLLIKKRKKNDPFIIDEDISSNDASISFSFSTEFESNSKKKKKKKIKTPKLNNVIVKQEARAKKMKTFNDTFNHKGYKILKMTDCLKVGCPEVNHYCWQFDDLNDIHYLLRTEQINK